MLQVERVVSSLGVVRLADMRAMTPESLNPESMCAAFFGSLDQGLHGCVFRCTTASMAMADVVFNLPWSVRGIAMPAEEPLAKVLNMFCSQHIQYDLANVGDAEVVLLDQPMRTALLEAGVPIVTPHLRYDGGMVYVLPDDGGARGAPPAVSRL